MDARYRRGSCGFAVRGNKLKVLRFGEKTDNGMKLQHIHFVLLLALIGDVGGDSEQTNVSCPGLGAAPCTMLADSDGRGVTVYGELLYHTMLGPVERYSSIRFGTAERWMPPVMYDYPPGVALDATGVGSGGRPPICWQMDGITRPPSLPVDQTEDCLFLQVFVSPRVKAGALRATRNGSARSPIPVVVWLYGGSLIAGSTESYPGIENIARLDDVVLVVPNYRLGALGFLSTPALDATDPRGVSGNYGLLDILLALRWVKRHVSKFGGDPERVTVLGQSSGGTAILGLFAAPAARGLFHAAVSLSASPNVSMTIGDAQRIFELAIAGRTNCSGKSNSTSTSGPAKCLRALPAAVVASMLPRPYDVSPELPLTPKGQHYPGLIIVDGVTVTTDAATALARGKLNVPLLLQTELAEMDTYENNRTINQMNHTVYVKFLEQWLAEHGFRPPTTGTAAETATALAKLYEPELTNSTELGYQIMLAEYSFLCGNVALAGEAAHGAGPGKVWASVGVHRPCHPLLLRAAAAPTIYPGHNWDLIAAIRSWDFYAVHYGTAPPYVPCAADVAWGDRMRRQWFKQLAATGEIDDWPSAADSPGTVGLVGANGTQPVLGYSRTRCAALAELGIDQRYWLVN